MFSTNKINVFISYSWDSEEHKQWVYKLARDLYLNNLQIVIDKIHLRPGDHKLFFMEKAIKGSDFVLLIITEKYSEKASLRIGGVGYEYNIINDELFEMITNNNKFIPIVRQKEKGKILPVFLNNFAYLDMSNDSEYNIKIKELINRLNNVQFQISDFIEEGTVLVSEQQSKETKNMTTEEGIIYKDIDFIKEKIDKNFQSYFDKVFGLTIDENLIKSGIPIGKLKGNTKNNISSTLKGWEKEINSYRETFQKIFNQQKITIYESIPEDFKTKQFRNNLWTVSAAMRTKDPDLARYKKDFGEALAEDILDTFKLIVNDSANYVKNKADKINFDKLETIDGLQFDFLDKPELSLKKIIGFGIRSEILHRNYPAYFPIMTQRSLWGMYFLTSLEKEFITIEEKSRKAITRVSHNWTYDYARFTFYNNYLYLLLAARLKKEYNVEILPEIRFGYCNEFLIEIATSHKEEIKDLHQWTDFDE
ncbi:MAG: toll/interleukin-1 receptor domain-containing protein [Melioribacteraceae bacterium]